MTLSVVGERGTVTIPVDIRKKIKLQKGDKVAFTISDDMVVMQPVHTTLLDYHGSVKVSGPQAFDAIRKQVLATRATRGE
ncbi:MAG: AbrB/MazE/SpoVT family DNA-binding domain-containing protein [Anaerolineales bacterium]|nr:MAG: AbrB/MazE/SpoVT family DNA-binding domain-containing protein [Anaerolineales bacterium]